MSISEERELFIRQRRNLMGISIVIFFFTFSGIKFTQLNILGNTFEIINSEIVNISLWIVFAYWFMRYFHYLPPTKIYMTYEEKLRELTSSYVRAIFDARISEVVHKPNEKFEFRSMHWDVMPSGRNPLFIRKFKVYYDSHLMNTDGSYRSIPGESMDVQLSEGLKVDLKLWWRAVNYTIWKTSYVSEYALPLLLAMGVILASDIYYLIAWW